MKAQIVIGAGFGDEGKGSVVDYLCSRRPDSCVVRFSGGQQAAHNVVIGEQSHIHSSYGSGTLRGLPSYFTEHCCIYPPNMMREQGTLVGKGCSPRVFIHPFAKITTPYDVAAGKVRETQKQHGSIGMGIGTTMARISHFNAIDLKHEGLRMAKLDAIHEYYQLLTYSKIKEYNEYVEEEMPSFLVALKSMDWNIEPYYFLTEFPNLVFEGSQGIMLDKDIGIFPNVTFSNTTSKNAIEVCHTLGLRDVDMWYVTRCYSTRHGKGWFPDNPVMIDNTEGETNVWNKWQEHFRYGEIDYDLLNHAIACDDTILSTSEMHYFKNLVVTCLDHRPGFEFDYSKLKDVFFSIHENRSPVSATIKKVNNELV